MPHSDEEQQFRAKQALTAIHEARQDADEAMDALMEAHQSSGKIQAEREDLHTAVMRLYNRVRPYLHQTPEYWQEYPLHYERTESGQIIYETVETEGGEEEQRPRGIFGLQALDAWRLAETSVTQTERSTGEEAQEHAVTKSLHLPPDIAVRAYDALNEAIVALKFAAEPGVDVETTHLDDAPDEVDQGTPPQLATDGAGGEADAE